MMSGGPGLFCYSGRGEGVLFFGKEERHGHVAMQQHQPA